MISIVEKPRCDLTTQQSEQFVKLTPDIVRHAKFMLRNQRPQEREEALAEVVAYAFCAFRRLAELGKLEIVYASPLTRFGVARWRAGRRIGNRPTSRDVLARASRYRYEFSHLHLPGNSFNVLADALADNTLTPIPDQVAFRLDFPIWLRGLKRRDRELVRFLALGNTPSEATRHFRVSRARVSQMRRALHAGWQVFEDEVPRKQTESQLHDRARC